eukprot:4686867-Prymnesium_polylepis.1
MQKCEPSLAVGKVRRTFTYPPSVIEFDALGFDVKLRHMSPDQGLYFCFNHFSYIRGHVHALDPVSKTRVDHRVGKEGAT